MKADTAIEACDLTRLYGDLYAVDGLTLSVGNEIFGLLGPNGSGKTTTVLMLTTLLRPTSGSATVCGHDVVEEAREVREHISYVPQDMAVDIKLTGRENVALFAKLYGVNHRDDRIDEVLAIMELDARADDLVRTYSGGMRRRLELAQALVHEPQVLFLDEPTSGLDPLARRAFWRIITQLASQGRTMIVTTHFMEEAEYCDRIAIQDKGEMLALGTPAEVRKLGGENCVDMNSAFIAIVENSREKRGYTR